MIIDADTHISPFKVSEYDVTVDDLLRNMDRAGVDKSLTWLRPPYFRDVTAANRYVYESMTNHPDRILGFGWVDPHLGYDKMRDEIKRCLEEYGFYGVKMNGAQNQFYIDDEEMALPLIEDIVKGGGIVAFHIGTDAYEATHPFRMGKIAQMFPDAQFLMVHMGGVGFHDLSNAAFEVMDNNPNITGIGSAIRPINVLKGIKKLGADRVCYGSDFPFNLMHVEVASYHALMDGELDETDQQKVMGGNIARLFRLGEVDNA